MTTTDGERFECDALIVATPLEMAQLEFEGVALSPQASMQRTYLTVHGRLWPGGQIRLTLDWNPASQFPI